MTISDEALEAKVLEIFRENCDENSITPDSVFNRDFEFDSMTAVHVQMDIEEFLGIEELDGNFHDGLLCPPNLVTLRSFIEHVAKQVK